MGKGFILPTKTIRRQARVGNASHLPTHHEKPACRNRGIMVEEFPWSLVQMSPFLD